MNDEMMKAKANCIEARLSEINAQPLRLRTDEMDKHAPQPATPVAQHLARVALEECQYRVGECPQDWMDAALRVCQAVLAVPPASTEDSSVVQLVSPRELRSALRKLAFMARTSGGTAGEDTGLKAACSEAEALLARPYIPAAPQPPQAVPDAGNAVADALAIILGAMRSNPEYAWSWHCNIAMSFVDAGGDHYIGNLGAAGFMRLLAGVEPAHELPTQPQAEAATLPMNPLAKHGYTMSESDVSGYRLVVGFETLSDLQAAHKFVAHAAKAARTPAEAVAPSQATGWYCAHCQRSVTPNEVTFREQHEACGRIITDDEPPAALRRPSDRPLREAVRTMAQALASGEWAEHVATGDADVTALEVQITRLLGKAQAAQPPAATEDSSAVQPVANPMTAGRAAGFLSRFMHDEKMLGANEQAALRFAIDALQAAPQPGTYPACKGMLCGCTDGLSHSPECSAEHAASLAGGTFVKGAPPPCPLVGVAREDANNYSLILAALGMEEEGDPVAAVRQLIAKDDAREEAAFKAAPPATTEESSADAEPVAYLHYARKKPSDCRLSFAPLPTKQERASGWVTVALVELSKQPVPAVAPQPAPQERRPLTDERIDAVTTAQWGGLIWSLPAHRAYARAIERACAEAWGVKLATGSGEGA